MYSTQSAEEKRSISEANLTAAELFKFSDLKLSLVLWRSEESFKRVFQYALYEKPELCERLKNKTILFRALPTLTRCQWLIEITKDQPEHVFFYNFAKTTYNALDLERHVKPSISENQVALEAESPFSQGLTL
jgi:hypothetical protein